MQNLKIMVINRRILPAFSWKNRMVGPAKPISLFTPWTLAIFHNAWCLLWGNKAYKKWTNALQLECTNNDFQPTNNEWNPPMPFVTFLLNYLPWFSQTTKNSNESAEYGKCHNCCHSFIIPQPIIIASPPCTITYYMLQWQPNSFRIFFLYPNWIRNV